MADIIVVGAGPAGLTAAIYARRAGRSVLVMEKSGFGGQMTFSPKIENYPGYVSVSGSELADKMVEQAISQGAEFEFAEVTAIEKSENGFIVTADTGSYQAKAVIIAAGAKHRRLGVPGEDELIGNGISFCAVCDGAFYADREVAVIGGGNSALQEALQLSEICSKVTVIQDMDRLTGEKQLADAVYAAENIEVILSSRVTGFAGEGELITVNFTSDGKAASKQVNGVFVAIGLVPEAGIFSNLIEVDPRGYASSGEDCTTVTKGVFVAGDCRTKNIRQISTAIADGASAALAACELLG